MYVIVMMETEMERTEDERETRRTARVGQVFITFELRTMLTNKVEPRAVVEDELDTAE